MNILRSGIAATILFAGIALAAADAEALPIQSLAPAASARQDVQAVWCCRYGWRRPVIWRGYYGWRRPFFPRYAYGWRRPFGWRGYGYGWHRGYGWRNRRLLGSRAR